MSDAVCERVSYNEEIFGPLYIREMHFKRAGDYVPGHTHNYHHVTVIYRGTVRCKFGEDGEERDYVGPTRIFIHKGIEHGFTALSDDVYAECWFVHRDAEGKVCEEWQGVHEGHG